MTVDLTSVLYIIGVLLILVNVVMFIRRNRKNTQAKISLLDRLIYGLQSRGTRIVVLCLVSVTLLAQVLYNSAGQLAPTNQYLSVFLLATSAASSVAFALFEISVIFSLHELVALDESIKQKINAEKLIRRGFGVLAVASLVNFISLFYFLALAWHAAGGSSAKFPLDNLPLPWNYVYYAIHAATYTAILYLAGIWGERPKAPEEVALAAQRSLEQLAVEGWRLQNEAKLAKMRRDGDDMSPAAAVLASPETAERIALLDLAMDGRMSVLEAAELRKQGNPLEQLRGPRPENATVPQIEEHRTPVLIPIEEGDPDLLPISSDEYRPSTNGHSHTSVSVLEKPVAIPVPGTKAFTALVRKTIGKIEASGNKATVAEVARLINESEANVESDYSRIMNARGQ